MAGGWLLPICVFCPSGRLRRIALDARGVGRIQLARQRGGFRGTDPVRHGASVRGGCRPAPHGDAPGRHHRCCWSCGSRRLLRTRSASRSTRAAPARPRLQRHGGAPLAHRDTAKKSRSRSLARAANAGLSYSRKPGRNAGWRLCGRRGSSRACA